MESYRPILSISKRHLPDFGGTTYDRQTASYEDLLRLGLQEKYDSVVEHKWPGVEGVFIATDRLVNASPGEIESFIKIQKQLTNNIRALI